MGRNREAAKGWSHQRNPVPRVASQRGTSKESQWEMEDVCRFHGSQQGLPKGFLLVAQY